VEEFGDAAVFGAVGWDDDGLRAEAEGLGHGLGGVAAEDAGFVGGGGNDTATAAPANEDGFADEVRVAGAFDGDEEGVEIEVGDALGKARCAAWRRRIGGGGGGHRGEKIELSFWGDQVGGKADALASSSGSHLEYLP